MTNPLKDLFSIESIGQQLAFGWKVDFLCETEHSSSSSSGVHKNENAEIEKIKIEDRRTEIKGEMNYNIMMQLR